MPGHAAALPSSVPVPNESTMPDHVLHHRHDEHPALTVVLDTSCPRPVIGSGNSRRSDMLGATAP